MICARSEISRQASCEVVYGFTLAGRHHSLHGPSVERCLLKNTFPPVCLGVPRDCWKPELGRRGGCTPELLVVMCGTPVITVGFFFQPYLLSPLALPETVENWGKAWLVQTGAVGGDVWNSGYNRRFFRSH